MSEVYNFNTYKEYIDSLDTLEYPNIAKIKDINEFIYLMKLVDSGYFIVYEADEQYDGNLIGSSKEDALDVLEPVSHTFANGIGIVKYPKILRAGRSGIWGEEHNNTGVFVHENRLNYIPVYKCWVSKYLYYWYGESFSDCQYIYVKNNNYYYDNPNAEINYIEFDFRNESKDFRQLDNIYWIMEDKDDSIKTEFYGARIFGWYGDQGWGVFSGFSNKDGQVIAECDGARIKFIPRNGYFKDILDAGLTDTNADFKCFKIKFADNVKSFNYIGGGNQDRCGHVSNLVLGKDFEYFKQNCFDGNGIKFIVAPCNRVVEIENDGTYENLGVENNNFILFVKDELVNDYKASSWWSGMSSNIYGLSDFDYDLVVDDPTKLGIFKYKTKYNDMVTIFGFSYDGKYIIDHTYENGEGKIVVNYDYSNGIDYECFFRYEFPGGLLTEIDIPAQIGNISGRGFAGHSLLSKITLRKEDGLVNLDGECWDWNVEGLKVYVPAALLSDYQNSYSEHADKFEAIV